MLLNVIAVLIMRIRTYSELMTFETFEERYDYLKIPGVVGQETFGFDRYFNQRFYQSKEWKDIRHYIIARDEARDLGCFGHDIYDKRYIRIHHMNPISVKDIMDSTEYLLNPEFLITTSSWTHRAIHYGDKSDLMILPKSRSKNDTCPWKK